MIINSISKDFNPKTKDISISNKNTDIYDANKVAFKSRPIFHVNLKQLAGNETYKTVPALFSEIIKDDKKDEKQFLKILELWKESIYCQNIYNNYKKADDLLKVYAVELIEKNPLCKKVVALISTKNPSSKDSYMDLNLIEARPDLQYKNQSRTIKGAGELGMYGIIKLAFLNQAKGLSFETTPISYKFYDQINIKDSFERYRFLEKNKMEEFLKSIEEKYNFGLGSK